MTMDAIVTRVERRLIDLPTRVTVETVTLVNEAIKAACERHNFHEMKAEAPFTTVDATQLLGAVPARFKETRDVPFLRDGELGVLGTTEITELASLQEALRDFPLDDTNVGGRPLAILREYDDDSTTDQFLVFPFPDTSSQWDNGLFRVVIPYWRYPAALAAGQTNYFTDNWEEYLVAAATAEGFNLSWAEERAARWEVRAESRLRSLIKADKRAKLTRVAHLAVHSGVFGSRAQGRL